MIPDFRLLDAVRNGSVSDVERAINAGANIHCQDFNGRSVLEVAEKYHKNDMVGTLIKRGADPNQQIGNKGNRLLHIAARTSNLGFANALVQNGATVNATNNAGLTPLAIATRYGHEYLAELLIGSGADVNAVDPKTGNTPIHLAAINGDKAMLRLLRANGADPARTSRTGYTALHEAAACGHSEAVAFLLDRSNLTSDQRRALLPRVRLAAELHGHTAIAASLQIAEDEVHSSFAERVRESQRSGPNIKT